MLDIGWLTSSEYSVVHLMHQCAYQRLGVMITMVLRKLIFEVSRSTVFVSLREFGGACCKRVGADDYPISRGCVQASKSKQAFIA